MEGNPQGDKRRGENGRLPPPALQTADDQKRDRQTDPLAGDEPLDEPGGGEDHRREGDADNREGHGPGTPPPVERGVRPGGVGSGDGDHGVPIRLGT